MKNKVLFLTAIALLGATALFVNTHKVFAANPQRGEKVFTGGLQIGATGNNIGWIKFGHKAISTGGTVAVADADISGNTVVTVQRSAAAGTKGVSYEVAITPGTGFSITSLDSTNSTQTLDTSTIAYIEVDPGTPKAAQTPSD